MYDSNVDDLMDSIKGVKITLSKEGTVFFKPIDYDLFMSAIGHERFKDVSGLSCFAKYIDSEGDILIDRDINKNILFFVMYFDYYFEKTNEIIEILEDEGFEIMFNNLGEHDYKLLNEGYRLKPDGSVYKYKRKGMNFEDAFNKSVNLLNKSRKEKTAEKVKDLYNELDELEKKDPFLALGSYFSRNQLIEVKERGYEREVIYIIRPDYLDFKLPFLSIESAATYIANTLYREFGGPKPTEDIIDQHKRDIRRSIRKRSGLVAGFGVVDGGKYKDDDIKKCLQVKDQYFEDWLDQCDINTNKNNIS